VLEAVPSWRKNDDDGDTPKSSSKSKPSKSDSGKKSSWFEKLEDVEQYED